MSLIYTCVGCDQLYCADCDGGEDQCPVCHQGPLCDDCAADHETEHKQENSGNE